jgi:ring-1,2-phenylacetyl-CoA epoxidase subunit PaaE
MPPNGSFGPHGAVERSGTYVAFASGCGITPVMSIIQTLLSTAPACNVLLFYGNRGTARAMLLEDLLALKDRYLDRFAVHFVMSREPQEVALLNGHLDGPKIHTLAQAFFEAPAVAGYFVCGPGTMIEDVTQALHALGVDKARIHTEHFSIADTQPTETAVAPSVASSAEGITQVTVVMDGRRKTFPMSTHTESVLDAAARAGLDLPFSCKAGVCSTCRTKVVRGEVELAQNYALEDWELEQGFILACQAHAKTPELELNYDES